MKTIQLITTILLSSALVSAQKHGEKPTTLKSVTEKAEEEEPAQYKEEGKRGRVLQWRFTKLAGRVANHGQWVPTKLAAEKDMWEKAATNTNTVDGYQSQGVVIGAVFETASPPKLIADKECASLQKKEPGRPSDKTLWRWVITKQCVMAIVYAERHGPKYEYFTTDNKQLRTAPPNMPQNEPPKE